MRKLLLEKLSQSVLSVIPIMIIVGILHFTVTPIPFYTLMLFILSSVLVILGITFFNLGVDTSMMPMGEKVGSTLVKTRNLPFIILTTFIIGVFITIAEPDLKILASQINGVPDLVLIVAVAVGVGVALVLSFLRVLLQIRLSYILIALYSIIFILSFFTNTDIISISFEAGGVTTGPIMVPFVMALGLGMAYVRGDKTSEEDSFGLISFCLVGPIITVLLLGMFYQPSGGSALSVPNINSFSDVFNLTLSSLPTYFKEVAIALLPIVVLFIVFQIFKLRLNKKTLLKMFVGTLYTYIGLILFLASVNVGFMPTGYFIGSSLVERTSPWFLVVIGLILGYFIVAAEPAVFVLKHQVEDITDGAISAKSMGIGLSIGVALSVGLSMIRVLYGFSILYLVIPGYVLALLLTFIVPPLFTSIAFDSGAVASGPLAATFLLPLAIGASEAVGGNIFTDAFGIVAIIALTPVITILCFGVAYRIKSARLATENVEPVVEDVIIEYDNPTTEDEDNTVEADNTINIQSAEADMEILATSEDVTTDSNILTESSAEEDIIADANIIDDVDIEDLGLDINKSVDIDDTLRYNNN